MATQADDALTPQGDGMNIAIIGAGISGLTAAYYLHKTHNVTVYEKNNYIGGHTATKDVEWQGDKQAVDTGFIVYNDRTYPRFISLLEELGIVGQPTEMSFSVSNIANGLEYNGHTLQTLFAQRRNLFNPNFYRLIFEILRFNRLAKRALEQSKALDTTLGDFLIKHHFSDYFCKHYILPMGAAIWSSTLADMRAFPLGFFLRFFLNHGLLDIVNRPQWYVIPGGSRSYISPMIAGFKERIFTNANIGKVVRNANGVVVEVDGQPRHFDALIIATHSDEALGLLSDATKDETTILSAMEYQSNRVTLHTDEALLPKRKKAWAAWNYRLDAGQGLEDKKPVLTYDMNILQGLKSPHTYCVTLNADEHIQANRILAQFDYSHPVFSSTSIIAQAQKYKIDGIRNTWFCGAYWRNGFHEDGVASALDVVEKINALTTQEKVA
jgi:predicted NAD/FAD-binding protein